MEAPVKTTTNKQLKTILIAVLVVSVIVMGALLMRKQTVQLTMSEDGSLATGEIKNHWKVPFKKAA